MAKVEWMRMLSLTALLVAGCHPDTNAERVAAHNIAGGRSETPAPVATAVRFDGPAAAAAITAVRDATATMDNVTISAAHSLRIMAGSGPVATFVTGEGTSPDATYAGCFAALVQDGGATVVRTIGSGSWEAETCGGISAVGILSATDPVLIGAIYEAFSPNATVVEPIVLRWDRTAGTFAVDATLSTRVSTAGVTTVTAMRRLVQQSRPAS